MKTLTTIALLIIANCLYSQSTKSALDIDIQTPEILQNIRFTANNHRLFASSYAELNKLALKLKNDTSVKVTLIGFTEKNNTPEFCKNLSLRRAETVRTYLVEKQNIESNRIDIDEKCQTINFQNKEVEKKNGIEAHFEKIK